MTASEIIEEAKKVIEGDEIPPLDFTIGQRIYCRKCGKDCELKYMTLKALLPVSTCCEWFYGIDFSPQSL